MAITSDRAGLARQDQAPAAAITPRQRAGYERGRCLIIGALTPGQAACCAAAPGHVCGGQDAAGKVRPGGPMRVRGAVAGCPRARTPELHDHPGKSPRGPGRQPVPARHRAARRARPEFASLRGRGVLRPAAMALPDW
jgi:hypothetical protein